MTSQVDVALELVERIAAVAALAGEQALQVTFGHPGRELETQGIVVGQNIDGDQEAHVLGPQTQSVPVLGMEPSAAGGMVDEQYVIDVSCECAEPGATAAEVSRRAAALGRYVETAVREQGAPPLGLEQIVTLQIGRVRLRQTFSGDGRSAVLYVGVNVHARV